MKLPIDDLAVTQIGYTFQISIAIGMGHEFQFETELVLTDSSGQSVSIDPETADDSAKVELAKLIGRRVVIAEASAEGDLAITFDSGFEIRVPYDFSYEAWNLTGPAGYKVVSQPGGGGLAIWDPLV